MIFYWEISKNFSGSYFFNAQIDNRYFRNWTVLLEKMLWYDKSMESLKTCVTQERGERRGHSRKKWCHSLKKNPRLCERRAFWMTPMMLNFFAIFFMSVFNDDVSIFLWNKQTIYIKININYIYKTGYLQNYSIMVCEDSKQMNE